METPYSSASRYASPPDLSIGNLFGRAFDIFKTNPGLMVLITLIYMGVVSLPEYIGGDGPQGILFSLISIAISGPMALGYYGVMLRFVRDEPVRVGNLFDGFQNFGQAIGVYLLTALLIFIGILVFIIPGIILSLGLWPALMLVYDGREGVVDVLKEAWDMTNGHKTTLFLLFVVTGIFVLAGLIAFVIGIVVTATIGMIILCLAYEELRKAEV